MESIYTPIISYHKCVFMSSIYDNFTVERCEKNMIQISKEEAQFLRANGVKEGITRTSRQCSHRHTYWCAEDRYILTLLDEFNKNTKVVETYGEV